MSYSINPISDGCYEGTTCLINKLGIENEKQLAQIEAAVTLAKISALEQHPINGNFDFEHYKAIHRFIFEDLYDWAGMIRSIDITKNGTRFVPASEIDSVAASCFDRLNRKRYFKGQDIDDFIDSIVDFYNTTNILHPFREGNGRTQRVFIEQLIRYNGYEFNFSDIDSDELMTATIHAAKGVDDYLKKIFKAALYDRISD